MSGGGRSPFWARSPRRPGSGLAGTGRGLSGGGSGGAGGNGSGGSGGSGGGGLGSNGPGSSGGRSGGRRSAGSSPWRGSGPGPGTSGAALGSAGGVLSWIWIRVAALLAVIVVLVAAAGFLLQRANGGPVATQARSTGHDALWLDNAWLDGRRSPADLRLLASRIRGSGISDVYVFAGGLDSAGRLAPAGDARAGAFLATFHSACPGVRVSASLGGVTGSGHINLGDTATRGHILAAAAALLRAGFGGVQYNLGAVTSGDTGLLALLSQTRKLGPDPLSVAAPKLEPLPNLSLPAHLVTHRPVFWTPGYLTQVASLVDQVAVLSFDTGMPFQSWYGGYVERETALALRAVPRHTRLLIGVPAFHSGDLGHHAGAETVAAAIHGIRVAVTAGAGSDDRTSNNSGDSSAGSAGAGGRAGAGGFGVALFAADTATAQDWTSYLQDWLRPGSDAARRG